MSMRWLRATRTTQSDAKIEAHSKLVANLDRQIA
jgi:hypothetical protein